MKTKSFLLGAAALMLVTACSNDEVVKVAENSAAIGFSSFVNKSTRATDATDFTYENLNDLKVWGVTSRGEEIAASEIFGGELVSKGSAAVGSPWTYSPLRYWIAGNDYSFAAIAPADADTKGVTVSQSLAEGWSEAGLTIAFDNKKAEAALDLLYATNSVTNAAADNSAVELDLKHMLSRVKFQFINNFPGAETIEIENLKILNAPATAEIEKAAATGTWSNATGTFEVPFAVAETNGKTVTTEHMYLIPLTDAVNYKISFTVKLKNGENVLAEYVHNGGVDGETVKGIELGELNYKNNCSYIFKATIDATNIDPDNELKPIEFTPSVSNWEDWGTENDIVLPN